MATSGTVATTTISTAKVLEHALRRCGIAPSKQTPEMVGAAKENLFLLLLALANRGFNLWCVDQNFIGLADGQLAYDTTAGTIDVLNVVYCQPSRATGTNTTAATSMNTALDEATTVMRVGLKFNTITAADTVVVSHSSDGATYTTALSEASTSWATGQWYWFQLDPSIDAQYWRVSTTNVLSVNEFYLATASYEIPLPQWNRDDYLALNNKRTPGRPSTNYFLEKLIPPRITLWPVPNNNYDHLLVMAHRQVQDVGSLSQTLELPDRWFDGIIWQLAARSVFEVPGVEPSRIELVLREADKHLIEAEGDETDGAPITYSPSIRVYTR